MTEQAQEREFQIEIDLQATRDEVWEAIATRDGLTSWFPAHAEVIPGEGGRIVWNWDNAYDWPLTIEAWEPGERLMARYDSGIDDGAGGTAPLFVEFVLAGEGGVTTLRLTHSGFGAGAGFDHEYDGVSRGWAIELQSLRLYLEHHRGRRRQLAWSRTSTTTSPEVAMQRLVGTEGIGLRPALRELGADSSFSARLGSDTPLDGIVAAQPTAISLSATLPDLDHAWFHAHAFESPVDDTTQVWVWLARYGAPDECVARYRAAIKAMLHRSFPADLAASEGAVA